MEGVDTRTEPFIQDHPGHVSFSTSRTFRLRVAFDGALVRPRLVVDN